MGYTTTFKGSLSFVVEPTAKQLAALNEIFGEDCRDHPEWDAPGLYYVDLKLTDDYSGIEHDGSEKTYDLDKIVNVVLRVGRQKWPELALTGTMVAQGEDAEDRWALTIGEDGWAHKQKLVITGQRIQCPHCEHRFILEGV